MLTRSLDAIEAAVRAGSEIHQAFRDAGGFPDELVDAIEAGEQAGRLSESLEKLADTYMAQAKTSATALAILTSVLVWLLIAGLLIMMIFRIFGFYLGILNDLSTMR